MREIKFRGYNPKTKKMFNNIGLEVGICMPTKDNPDGVTSCYASSYGYDGESVILELMQYTGLKDQNGVEIFEGDIVKHSKGYVWTVVFEENESRFALQCKEPLFRPIFKDRAYNLEVIGNIYENPELLEALK